MTGTETYVGVPTGWLSLKSGTIIPYGTPPPPPPVNPKSLGIFTSGNNTATGAAPRQDPRYPGTTINNTPADTLTSSWPTKPNHGSFYFNWNTTVGSVPLVSTWAGQGRTLQISLSTKIGSSGGVGSYVLWSDIATGTYDSHIISTISALDRLGVVVNLCLDVEPDGEYSKGGVNDGVASGQTTAQYKAAATRFCDLVHGNSTNIEAGVWFAGGNQTACAQMLPPVSKIDSIGWDPYKVGTHPASETATQTFSTFINGVIVPNGYSAIKRRIHETGIKTDLFSNGTGSFDVATQVAFYQSIPAAMDALQITSVVWFRANSGSHNYIPVPFVSPSEPDAAFRDMLDAAVGG